MQKIIDRVKNIIVTPKTEWEVVAAETTPQAQIITGYILPLAAIAALAGFIGNSLVGYSLGPLGSYRMPIGTGLTVLVLQIVMAVVAVFVVGFVITALAPTFSAEKDFQQAFKVAAYSYTPAWIAGILTILPLLGVVAIIAAIYGIYLMYLGLPRLMKNPEDKSAGYTAVVVIVAIVVHIIIGVIVGGISSPRLTGLGEGRQQAIERLADPGGKLDQFARKMEEAGKKMEDAQKSGDPQKQMEAALGALGTAMSGGRGVDPLSLEQLKPFVPETFAGLARTESRAERSGVTGFTIAKAEGVYGGEGKRVELEVVDTGGAAGLMGLAAWVGVTGERETDQRIERIRREGNRVVNEEVSKRGGMNKYSVVLADRFIVSAEGTGVDLNTLKSGVASLDLAKLEAMK